MDTEGKCTECGEKFNRFSSFDFDGKLCNKCYNKSRPQESMFGSTNNEASSTSGSGFFGGL